MKRYKVVIFALALFASFDVQKLYSHSKEDEPLIVHCKIVEITKVKLGYLMKMEIDHLFRGNKEYVGKTFTELFYTTDGSFNGYVAQYQPGFSYKEGIWCLKSKDSKLTATIDDLMPFFCRSIITNRSNLYYRYEQHLKLVLKIEELFSLKKEQQLQFAKKLFHSEVPEIARWSAKYVAKLRCY